VLHLLTLNGPRLAPGWTQWAQRFHDLRHTAGTLALRQGMPLHAVSKMLGHSDPAMTLRRYAHVLEDMEDAGGRAMDNLF
jgi:integrase